LKNQKYTLAMARTPQPNSATNQFFINTADNGFLNREEAPDEFGYAVFGKVVKGMEVVDAIDKAATDFKSGMKDVPTKPIFIKSVEILEKK
jgi:cyclophilin family peptidyl-prolyl cis-trans isomerase